MSKRVGHSPPPSSDIDGKRSRGNSRGTMPRDAASTASPVSYALLGSEPDMLANILGYASLPDVASICATCSHWNDTWTDTLNNDATFWRRICEKVHPEIIRLYDLCQESSSEGGSNGVGWKSFLRRRVTSTFEPSGLNQSLQRDFEMVFKPEGIIGFSCCCTRCTFSYDDTHEAKALGRKPAFEVREKGIWFFKQFLDGMNYSEDGCSTGTRVCYDGWDYLMANWEQESEIIRRWCAVMGIMEGEYKIVKPKSEAFCIEVMFERAVDLDVPCYNDDSDY